MGDLRDDLRIWSAALADTVPPIELEQVRSSAVHRLAPRRTRPWLAVAASSVVLAGALAVGFVVLSPDDDPTDPDADRLTTDTIEPIDSEPGPTEPTPSTTIPEPVEETGAPTIGDVGPAADGPDLGPPSVVSFAGLPLTEIAISPSGTRIARTDGEAVCIIDTSVGSDTPDAGCVDVGTSIDFTSLAWSPDESTIAFHEDALRFGDEPDITTLDVASGRIEVVTDDGISGDGSFQNEASDTDLTPFFDAGGVLHFFRIDDDPLSPVLFAVVDGDAVPLDDIEIMGFPLDARRNETDGRIAIVPNEVLGGSAILTVDLQDGSTTHVDARVDDEPFQGLADLAGDRALVDLVPDALGAAVRANLVDLDGVTPPQPLPAAAAGSDQAVTGFGLSPDGTRVILLLEDRVDSSGHQLLVATILDDGTLGPLGVLAEGDALAPATDDVTIRPLGLGNRREIAWMNDRIVFGLGPDQIVTLDILG